jgi:hypothetical protein
MRVPKREKSDTDALQFVSSSCHFVNEGRLFATEAHSKVIIGDVGSRNLGEFINHFAAEERWYARLEERIESSDFLCRETEGLLDADSWRYLGISSRQSEEKIQFQWS